MFALVFWLAFLPSATSLSFYLAFVAPVVVESLLKSLMWRRLIGPDDGIRHPRSAARRRRRRRRRRHQGQSASSDAEPLCVWGMRGGGTGCSQRC